MSQHSASPQSTGPQTIRRKTSPRIVISHHQGRTWRARVEGRGGGEGWGTALAALDYRSHAVTDGTPPTFYLDDAQVAQLRHECERLRVRVELRTWSTGGAR